MNAISTAIHTLSTALAIPRLLAILTLAIALLAIPAFSPDEAGAYRMSERTALRLCANAGGSIYYGFPDEGFDVFYLNCTLPSGASFTCFDSGGPFGNIVDCM